MSHSPVSYKRHRFPSSVIAHAVWLYFRFPLSLRLVEEMLLERGVIVSYETIRCWAKKFGPVYARRLRRKAPYPTDAWHLDEIVVTIGGRKHWLWRAVDQDGYVLDEIVQVRRNTKAAKRLLIRLMKKQGGVPKRIVTDKLGSYGAARRQIMPAVGHRSHKGLNNRAENLHLPLRKRERVMQRFRSAGALQRLISVFSAVRNLFVPTHLKKTSICIVSGRSRIGRAWPGSPHDHFEPVESALVSVNLTSPRFHDPRDLFADGLDRQPPRSLRPIAGFSGSFSMLILGLTGPPDL